VKEKRIRKSRAWVIKEKRMYHKNIYLWPVITRDNTKWYVYSLDSMHNPILLGELNTEVIVMDYIGLNDKNDKEIYEKDILKHYAGANYYINALVVWGGKWDYSSFGLAGKRPKELKCSDSEPNDYWDFLNKKLVNRSIIIGNNLENPELLQGQICKREFNF
jgi:uncharacterized phage protein (TIGR01671 family)